MPNDMEPVIIFGAGRTGRGFIAHLCHSAGVPFVLIDKDLDLVNRLAQQGSYRIEVLGNPGCSAVPVPARIYGIEEDWRGEFDRAALCFTAVFGSNLPELGAVLAGALARRFGKEGPHRPLNFITCENLGDAARALRESVEARLPGDAALRSRIAEHVGFSEGIVLKTCLGPGPADGPLTVRAEDFFELPCDRDAFRGDIPRLDGLRPLGNFSNQLVRKIYTYNCINAVITYLGAIRGMVMLSEAARDEEIYRWAEQAGDEASRALILEFGFDPEEQASWKERALRKFTDPAIPDPLSRNGADPRRKLGRRDRLIGPALLAFRHGIEPRAIAQGILAAFHFRDGGERPLLESYSGRVGDILTEVCGLVPGEALHDYLLKLRPELFSGLRRGRDG